jgi:hypothetical protein
MRGALIPLILTLALRAAASTEVHYEYNIAHDTACHDGLAGPFDVDRVLQNATLYQQVYRWMHDKDVLDWTFSADANVTDEPGRCTRVSYKAFVESPSFFARFMHNFHMDMQFPVSVDKQICLHGNAIVETATIIAPLIHELTLTAKYDVTEQHVSTILDAHYTVPWYLEFLVANVSEHLRTNFKEKVDAVVQSLCSPAPVGPLRLPTPQNPYLRRIRERYGQANKMQF